MEPVEHADDEFECDLPIAINPSSSASNSMSISKNLPIIHEILLNPACALYSGVRSSESEALLISHGIPLREKDFHASVMALIHHLVNGLCVYHSNIGCQSIVKRNDALDLSLLISDQILKAPVDILQVICSSLGYSYKAAVVEHSQLIRWLQARHCSLEENEYPSFQTTFDGSEKCVRPEALAIAASHGLSPVGTIHDIKNSVVAHIADAKCTQLSKSVPVLPPACVKLREDCPSELPQIPDNQNELRIFF